MASDPAVAHIPSEFGEGLQLPLFDTDAYENFAQGVRALLDAEGQRAVNLDGSRSSASFFYP